MAQVSHRVSKLLLPDDLPSRVVLLSPSGDLSIADAELTVKNTLQAENNRQILLKSFMFSCKSCSFIPNHLLSLHCSIILSIFLVGDELHAHAVMIGKDDTLVRLGDFVLPIENEGTSTDIAGISCSESGCLCILSKLPVLFFL